MAIDLEKLKQKFDKFFAEATQEEFEAMIERNRKTEANAQEAELWEDVFLAIHVSAQKYQNIPGAPLHQGLPNQTQWHANMIADLQQKYTLSLKSEQPEAVGFAEWLAITGWKPWIEQGRVKYWHHTDLLKGAWSTKDKYKEYLNTK